MRIWADRPPSVRPRRAMQIAREVLGWALQEDGSGRLRLYQSGAWAPVTVRQVLAAAAAKRQRQYRRDALRRARQVLRTRLVVEVAAGGDRITLDGRIASVARVVEVARAIDRSGWPVEPAELVYLGVAL